MDSDDPPTAATAEQRVEDSREQLERHLDELSEKLAPANLAASALDQINPTDLIKSGLKNPSVLAALLGAAVSIVALRRWRMHRRSK